MPSVDTERNDMAPMELFRERPFMRLIVGLAKSWRSTAWLPASGEREASVFSVGGDAAEGSATEGDSAIATT